MKITPNNKFVHISTHLFFSLLKMNTPKLKETNIQSTGVLHTGMMLLY